MKAGVRTVSGEPFALEHVVTHEDPSGEYIHILGRPDHCVVECTGAG